MGRGKKSGLSGGKRGKKGLKTAVSASQGMQSPELHVVEEETEDQGHSVECPSPHSYLLGPEPGLELS